ncbi:hypothetical protein NQ317_005431 [Molorchus minor]|uniref:Uncharacterized protein n=1 Tax=Molorchus minor TaxID=1323400 RepID=A0ABQ9JI85_9CUCU|nr:hypothetical protein NQ317_005431 [Molorchus minor]
MDDQSPLDNDELSEYDIYGKTPPRTKILRKNRERKQRDKQTSTFCVTDAAKYNGSVPSPKVTRAKTPLSRRNTVSTFYDELLAKADDSEEQGNQYNSILEVAYPRRCPNKYFRFYRRFGSDISLITKRYPKTICRSDTF